MLHTNYILTAEYLKLLFSMIFFQCIFSEYIFDQLHIDNSGTFLMKINDHSQNNKLNIQESKIKSG